jgi:heptosyltransferase I
MESPPCPPAPAPEPRLRIGIVMLTAVGDAVHVLPVVNTIKREAPETHITWVLQPGPAALVQGHPAVDEIVTFDRHRGWRAFADVRRELARRPFDLVIGLQSYLKAGVITAMTRAPIKLGYDRGRARDLNWLFTNERIEARPARHVQDEYLEFLEHLRMPTEPLDWGLGPWEHELAYRREIGTRFDRPLAALVIGSSKPGKDWLPDRWASLCDTLHDDFGLQPVLVGGRSPREEESERGIMAGARTRPVSLLGSGLRNLVSILHASSLVISLDTGPLHMAVALDRPTISLLGYSNPLRTGPYRRFHDLMINAYGETERGGELTRDTRPGRMPLITTREVIERVERWRARYEDYESSGRTKPRNA